MLRSKSRYAPDNHYMVIIGITDFRPDKMIFVYNTSTEMHFQVSFLRLNAILPH
jgi:hypothetical protein